jgi:hypothetical protein
MLSRAAVVELALFVEQVRYYNWVLRVSCYSYSEIERVEWRVAWE